MLKTNAVARFSIKTNIQKVSYAFNLERGLKKLWDFSVDRVDGNFKYLNINSKPFMMNVIESGRVILGQSKRWRDEDGSDTPTWHRSM